MITEYVTETGAVYSVDDNGFFTKTKNGVKEVSDRVFIIRSYNDPDVPPTVGHSMYLANLNSWWITTPLVEIRELTS